MRSPPQGYKLLSAQVEMIPQNGYIKLTNEDDIKNMQKMLDMFEDNDDVQNVWKRGGEYDRKEYQKTLLY